MVAAAYEHGKALNSASHFEIDDVIDPADSRRWVSTLLTADAADSARPGWTQAAVRRHLVGRGSRPTPGLLSRRAPAGRPRAPGPA